MTDEDAELAELQRRAYGPGESLANDEAARTRLAELEVVRLQGRDPQQSTADADVGTLPSESDSDPRAAEGSGADGAHGIRPRRSAALIVACSAIAAVALMLVVGGAGWAGGFVSGAVRANPPTAGAELVKVLQQLPDESVSANRDAAFGDDGTGGGFAMLEGVSEFEDLGENSQVFLIGDSFFETAAGDWACLQLAQKRAAEILFMTGGGTGCGDPSVGLSLDAIVVESADVTTGVPGVVISGREPGTLVRLVYDDAARSVAVWALEPPAEPDPRT